MDAKLNAHLRYSVGDQDERLPVAVLSGIPGARTATLLNMPSMPGTSLDVLSRPIGISLLS